jgi:hypothetical protein
LPNDGRLPIASLCECPSGQLPASNTPCRNPRGLPAANVCAQKSVAAWMSRGRMELWRTWQCIPSCREAERPDLDVFGLLIRLLQAIRIRTSDDASKRTNFPINGRKWDSVLSYFGVRHAFLSGPPPPPISVMRPFTLTVRLAASVDIRSRLVSWHSRPDAAVRSLRRKESTAEILCLAA